MNGLRFVKTNDELNRWPIAQVAELAVKVNDYCEANGIEDAELCRVEDNSWSDPDNERMDIEIRYTNAKGQPVHQKLLMLKGEVIDGVQFHERFKEFYPTDNYTGGDTQ